MLKCVFNIIPKLRAAHQINDVKNINMLNKRVGATTLGENRLSRSREFI